MNEFAGPHPCDNEDTKRIVGVRPAAPAPAARDAPRQGLTPRRPGVRRVGSGGQEHQRGGGA